MSPGLINTSRERIKYIKFSVILRINDRTSNFNTTQHRRYARNPGVKSSLVWIQFFVIFIGIIYVNLFYINLN